MSYSFDVTRTYEVPSMEGLVDGIKKQFKDPAVSRQVTYNTPNGSFTVSMEVKDKIQFDALIGTLQQKETYMGACGNLHHMGVGTGTYRKVIECKSTLKLNFQPDFNDESLKGMLTRFVDESNRIYSIGVRSLYSMDGTQHMGVAVQKPHTKN